MCASPAPATLNRKRVPHIWRDMWDTWANHIRGFRDQGECRESLALQAGCDDVAVNPNADRVRGLRVTILEDALSSFRQLLIQGQGPICPPSSTR